MITDVIARLAEGVNLGEDEARDVMNEIMTGQSTSAQVAAFLTALRMKGETLDELVGFARVPLEPGQTRTIRFTLHPSQLAFYDRSMKFVVEPGAFDVRVGAASDDIRLHARFNVSGEVCEYSTRTIVATRTQIE